MNFIFIVFLAAAVLTSKVSAEGGSVGRRVLASRPNESPIKSLENSQVSLKYIFFTNSIFIYLEIC